MQARTDRIHFPPVDPEALWKNVPDAPSPSTPSRCGTKLRQGTIEQVPILSTPLQGSPALSDSQGRNYFKSRELAGLVTPARTPSDILLRGPLYVDSSEDGGTPLSAVDVHEEAPVPFSSDSDTSEANRSDLLSQAAHHRERQEAIRAAIKEYEAKMTELLEWHREQERELLSRAAETSTGSSASSQGSARLRRGRSKLSERLYAAIEFNS